MSADNCTVIVLDHCIEEPLQVRLGLAEV